MNKNNRIALLFIFVVACCSCTGRSHNVNTAEKENSETVTSCADSMPDCFSKSFVLKGDYELHVYTLKNDGQIYRLVGDSIDTIIAEFDRQEVTHTGYTGIDFDDYFVISWFRSDQLYDKRTGEKVFDIEYYGYDTDHNLALRHPEGGGGLMLMNLKTGKEVNIYDYYPENVNEEGMIEVWNITNVTAKWIYLLNDTGVEPVEIRVPRSVILNEDDVPYENPMCISNPGHRFMPGV